MKDPKRTGLLLADSKNPESGGSDSQPQGSVYPIVSKFGSYKVISHLGSGGMGEVYLAHDSRLGRLVAIKLLRRRFALDSEIIQSFEQEARSTCTLNHPNIITIYELGSTGDTHYIAMEYVEGRTLRTLLANGPFGFRRLLSLARQIADGLANAHANGIVHLDLKPENVMVTDDGLVKILDFGMAVAVPRELESKQLGSPGSLRGTLAYMSPEQISARPVDFRADQFSFGAVLLEMATGNPAFGRATAVETLGAVTKGEPMDWRTVRRLFPESFCHVVERCLEKDKRYRYGSTQQLVRDLEKILASLPESYMDKGNRSRPVRRRNQSFDTGVVRRQDYFLLDTDRGRFGPDKRPSSCASSPPRSRIRRKSSC